MSSHTTPAQLADLLIARVNAVGVEGIDPAYLNGALQRLRPAVIGLIEEEGLAVLLARRPTLPSRHAARVEAAKREIQADVATGLLPASVRSWADLGRYVDANPYVWPADVDHADVDATNAVQAAVDAWLRTGPLTPPTVAQVEAWATNWIAAEFTRELAAARQNGPNTPGRDHRGFMGADRAMPENPPEVRVTWDRKLYDVVVLARYWPERLREKMEREGQHRIGRMGVSVEHAELASRTTRTGAWETESADRMWGNVPMENRNGTFWRLVAGVSSVQGAQLHLPTPWYAREGYLHRALGKVEGIVSGTVQVVIYARGRVVQNIAEPYRPPPAKVTSTRPVFPEHTRAGARKTPMSPRQMAALGWTRTDARPWKKVNARWSHVDGWRVEHCGHPTALHSWSLFSPEGLFVKTGAVHGDPTLGTAWDNLEAIARYVQGIPPRRGHRSVTVIERELATEAQRMRDAHDEIRRYDSGPGRRRGAAARESRWRALVARVDVLERERKIALGKAEDAASLPKVR